MNPRVMLFDEVSFAREVANCVVLLADGRIIEAGLPAEVFENPETERAETFLSQNL